METSAVLSGSVNPNGCQTTYKIEWGPSSSPSTYPNKISGSAGSGTGNVPVSHTASELQPNTGYHFRVSGTNSNGMTTFGPDEPFTTLKTNAGAFMSEGNVAAAYIGDQTELEPYIFAVDGSEAYCKKLHMASSGNLASPSSSVTLHPTFSGECAMFGFAGGTITTTGCDFMYVAYTKTTGAWLLKCSGSNKMILKAGTCEVTLEPQSIGSSMTYLNSGGIIIANIQAGVFVNVTKDGLLCPLNGVGKKNGFLIGKAILQGYVSGVPVNVTME
jgi:hypothetical protein